MSVLLLQVGWLPSIRGFALGILAWSSRVFLGYLLDPHSHAAGMRSTSNILHLPGHLNHTFLGLLAKIKCSICSLEFDNSNGGHCPPCYLTYFSGGLPNSGACTAGLAAWPRHCTTALAEHPLSINYPSTLKTCSNSIFSRTTL